jgi:hypothetical protein
MPANLRCIISLLPMKKTSLFVDLSNFYSRLVKSEIDTPSNLRSYFIDWFDFSRIANYLCRDRADVWIFYSGTKLGASPVRIDDQVLKRLIDRFDRQKGVTAYDVNIPGSQREHYEVQCADCGKTFDAVFKSEKGIDSSLIVHLFDTAESWDIGYLLSGDADFVPAVKSLRRRGKILNGAGVLAGASNALIKECYEFVDLIDFLKQDYAAYQLLGTDGLVTGRSASLLTKEPGISKARLIFDVSGTNGADEITFCIESNILDLETVRPKFVHLPVSQKLAGDKHSFTFDASFREILVSKLNEFVKTFGSWTDTSGVYGDVETCRLYVEYTWDTAEGKYLPST